MASSWNFHSTGKANVNIYLQFTFVRAVIHIHGSYECKQCIKPILSQLGMVGCREGGLVIQKWQFSATANFKSEMLRILLKF